MFGGERAQSEVLGTVLLLGLTVAVVGTTVALGGAALDDSQRTADLQRVEGAMTQVDSKASLVAHGESPSQRVSFGSGGGDVSVDHDAGRMVIAENETGDEIVNASLGALVYERDGTRIAYQGGGVWRSDGNRSRMVSAPEFHYRGETLTVPLVTISENTTANGDEVILTSEGSPNGHVAQNPVVDDIRVTVTGDYHEGWAAFFESRTDTRIIDRRNDSVTVLLRSELVGRGVSYSIGTLGANEFDLESIESLTADSYDSGGAGPSESRDNAVIAAGGEIDSPQGGGSDYVTIKGDLRARYDIQPNPNGIQNGDHPINVIGNVTERATIEDPDPVEGYLVRAIDEYDTRYGNASPTSYASWSDLGDDAPITSRSSVEDGLDVSGGSETYRAEDAEVIASDGGEDGTAADGDLTVDGGTVTFEAGGDHAGFRFDDADLSGGELVLDVTDGDLDLRVDDEFSLSGDGSDPTKVRVVGDGKARIHVGGDLALEGASEVTVDDDAELRVFHDEPGGDIDIGDGDDDTGITVSTGTNEPANSFWLFSNADSLEFDGDDAPVDLTGVVYAPNAEVDDAKGDVVIRGALTVDGFDDLDDARFTMRYDEALATAEVFDEVEQVPTINYLHVSTQEIRIEDG
ncbi:MULTISPECIES: DUF7289 family protein [Halorubrum]|uniref:DUF7305 domain-containing protein n=1 Tax=Halorubrum hochstenium ATCC 700873 TaxID=1227481 RepID=M0FN89_9EURY|nr:MULTISPECIES: hypothetical protein [Halorubrum]ELZ61425.1 hypothetical protein C467_01366 [Halorubrum hochstenium ATCC 700873]